MKWFVWLNPFVWFSTLKAYVKAHFWAWQLSSVHTMAATAFPLSLAYPNWARDAVKAVPEVWAGTKMLAIAVRDVSLELINSS